MSFVGAAVAHCGAAAIREGGAAKNAKCLGFFKERSRGAVYEREDVWQDALRSCKLPAPLHFALFLVSCTNKTPRARAYLGFRRVIAKPS